MAKVASITGGEKQNRVVDSDFTDMICAYYTNLCFVLINFMRIIEINMSNEIPHTNDLDQLDRFSKVQIDPFLTGIFQKIHAYNELLNDQHVDSSQINDIINELDDEWRQLMHQAVVVTGVVSFLDENSVGSGELTRGDFYEDHEMEFGGVFPVRINTESNSMQYLDGELHKYRLELRLSREGLTREGKRLFMNGTAKLDDIAGIEFPDAMSVEVLSTG